MESLERLKGQTILVTGGAGFIGSHVVEKLIDLNARVVVTYRAIDPGSYFVTSNLSSKTILESADIKDDKRMFDLVTKHEVSYIFHLAAQPIVTTAYHNPLETFASNIMGTVHVLEAARKYPGIKGVVIASSDKAYGKLSDTYTETDPLQGDHPYEVSKSAADLISTCYIKTYRLPIVITRFGNVYGPGDLNFNRIVPGMMETIIKGVTLKLRSDGSYVRDYIYVDDVADAYVLLLERLKKTSGEAYNVSCDTSLSVVDLIKVARQILKEKINYTIEKTAINEIPYQHLDYSKILQLGWKPKITLSDGLKKTLTWYKKYKQTLFNTN